MGGFNYVLGLEAMARMATLLGNSSYATRYTTAADKSRQVFHKTFYNEKLKAYGGDAGAIQTLTTPAIEINAPPKVREHSSVERRGPHVAISPP